jgi:hypothetical protein
MEFRNSGYSIRNSVAAIGPGIHCDTLHLLWGPLGALVIPLYENREAGVSHLPCDYRLLGGGSDETRTRDLRRQANEGHN